MRKMVSSCFSFLVKTEKKKKKTGGAGIASGEIRLEMKEQVLVEGL